MAEFMWGRDQKAVAMTEADAKNLTVVIVEAVTEAVTKKTSADALDQYRQMARLEMDLNRAREELSRKDGEIEELRSHITQLNAFVASMVPGSNTMFRPALAHGHQMPMPYTGHTQTGYATPELIQVPAPRPNGSDPA